LARPGAATTAGVTVACGAVGARLKRRVPVACGAVGRVIIALIFVIPGRLAELGPDIRTVADIPDSGLGAIRRRCGITTLRGEKLS
jgi:hypothetical protein